MIEFHLCQILLIVTRPSVLDQALDLALNCKFHFVNLLLFSWNISLPLIAYVSFLTIRDELILLPHVETETPATTKPLMVVSCILLLLVLISLYSPPYILLVYSSHCILLVVFFSL